MKIICNNQELELNENSSGADIAKALNIDLKSVIAYKHNGVIYDLYSPITSEGEIELILNNSEEAKDILNHSTAHLLAEAVLDIFKDAKLAIGPSIENGFYYDIDFGSTILKEEDLTKIEKKMKEFSKKNFYIKKEVISKEKALEMFKDNPYKVEIINELPENEEISIYRQGDFVDLCTGPHVPSTNYIKHFKLESLAGAYWRGDSKNKQLTRIYGCSFFNEEDLQNYLHLKEEAKREIIVNLVKNLVYLCLVNMAQVFHFIYLKV